MFVVLDVPTARDGRVGLYAIDEGGRLQYFVLDGGVSHGVGGSGIQDFSRDNRSLFSPSNFETTSPRLPLMKFAVYRGRAPADLGSETFTDPFRATAHQPTSANVVVSAGVEMTGVQGQLTPSIDTVTTTETQVSRTYPRAPVPCFTEIPYDNHMIQMFPRQ
jgi:hypothetical protein